MLRHLMVSHLVELVIWWLTIIVIFSLITIVSIAVLRRSEIGHKALLVDFMCVKIAMSILHLFKFLLQPEYDQIRKG